jgi:hypothetical protein
MSGGCAIATLKSSLSKLRVQAVVKFRTQMPNALKWNVVDVNEDQFNNVCM